MTEVKLNKPQIWVVTTVVPLLIIGVATVSWAWVGAIQDNVSSNRKTSEQNKMDIAVLKQQQDNTLKLLQKLEDDFEKLDSKFDAKMNQLESKIDRLLPLNK